MVRALEKPTNIFERPLTVHVGEWVEVVHDYSEGKCSEGGVAILTEVD
jgi:hypothetical protein